MGNQSSSTGGQAPPARTCYYELLEVDQNGTDDEIKKAYRRKALELHPDKNINDTENATRRFAEVQAAYEILSDPQERAWYDSHREAILHGLDEDDVDAAAAPEFRNVRMTSTQEVLGLVRQFNSTVPYTDDAEGFFGRLRDMFDHLAAEEMAAGDSSHGSLPMAYPSFGSASDDYDTAVKIFYGQWSGFSTRKTFSWKDKYRLPDAPDRRVRRLMEKENKKCREDAMREFNDAVRFLVTFARKRDPRYLPSTQSNADRQKALRGVVAAQAARSRAAHQEKVGEFHVPEWAQVRQDGNMDGDMSASSDDESELHHIECVVCDKTFKTEQQYQAHERSKKHIKTVQRLHRQMRRDGIELGLDKDGAPGAEASGASVPDEKRCPSPPVVVETPENKVNGESRDVAQQKPRRDSEESLDDDRWEDDEYAQRHRVEHRLAQSPPSGSLDHGSDQGLAASLQAANLDDKEVASKRVGKAKAKREKKAARQVSAQGGSQGGNSTTATTACANCGQSFESKNKLFAHLRTAHAAVAEQGQSKGSKRKQK